jgi:hypothetical protein
MQLNHKSSQDLFPEDDDFDNLIDDDEPEEVPQDDLTAREMQ